MAIEQSETAHEAPLPLCPMIRLVNAWRTGQTGRSSNIVQIYWHLRAEGPDCLAERSPRSEDTEEFR
jgi:hypothetical protein